MESKAQTIGYKYYLGLHMILCQGPIDALRQIRFDKRIAWQGVSEGGTITVNKPELFGGQQREGGVAGDIDVEMGAPAQTSNAYIVEIKAQAEPAYRGVFGLVFNQFYVGNNPYIKQPDFLLTRILTAEGGAEQWYPAKAPIEVGNPGGSGGSIGEDSALVMGDTFGVLRAIGINNNEVLWTYDPAGSAAVTTTAFDAANTVYAGWQDGRLAAVSAGGVEIWEVAAAHVGGVNIVLYDADTDQVFTGGDDGFLRVWDAADGSAVTTYDASANVNSIAFDGTHAYLSVDGNKVKKVLPGTGEVWEYDAGDFVTDILADGAGGAYVIRKTGIANGELRRINSSGSLAWQAGSFSSPQSGAFDADAEGYPWYADSTTVYRYRPSGALDVSWLHGLGVLPEDMFIDGTGDIWLATDGLVRRYSVAGDVLTELPQDFVGDTNSISISFGGAGSLDYGPDMNPAHMIRELYTNGLFGLGYSPDVMGDSFTTAADTLFDEGLGLSYEWSRQSTHEDMISEILRHIDGTVYVDRRTGKVELKLIRDDYDIGDLPVFDETNVVSWDGLGRREFADMVNAVTVTYPDIKADGQGSRTVTDIALVQDFGKITHDAAYPMIRWESLAARLAARDLKGLSSSLLSGEIVVNRDGDSLNPGDAIVLNSTRRDLSGVVVRIAEIDFGDGNDNGIRLKVMEDVFAIGATASVGGLADGDIAGSITNAPAVATPRYVAEAPYWVVVAELGHSAADDALAAEPDGGALVMAAGRPTPDAFSAEVWTEADGTFARDGTAEFVPAALLTVAATDSPTETTLTVGSWVNRSEVVTGQLASLGTELVRIDAVTETTVTVGRGCLDTVPAAHPIGTALVFWQLRLATNETSFDAADEVGVRFLPWTGQGTLALAAAPIDTVTMDSRAIRPLPPGNVQINGSYTVDEGEAISGDLVFTWAHRDRTAQTSAVFDDYTAGNIGPEAGVSYWVDFRWADLLTEDPGAVAATVSAGTGTTYTLEASSWPAPPSSPPEKKAWLRLRSRRTVGAVDYYEYQNRSFLLRWPNEPPPDGFLLADESGVILLADGSTLLRA